MTHSKTQVIGYARVSTAEQNPARQIEGLEVVDKLFTDYLSGASRQDRPGLNAAIDYIREGDTFRVYSIDRLARSLQDLTKIVADITGKGASVEFVKENLTFTTSATSPTDKLMFHLLGAFAEFERALIKERQREGIALAKAQGKYRGRTPIELTEKQQTDLSHWLADDVPKTVIAKRLKIGRSTLYRLLQATEKAGGENVPDRSPYKTHAE